MWTIRNLGGISLFLFGTTFLWLTPAFATRGVSTEGMLWSGTRALAVLTLAGFTIATYGLFHRDGWWESVALGSAALGLVTVLTYLLAATRSDEAPASFNSVIHLLGIAGVAVLLLVPTLERWVDSHVMG